LFPPAIDLFHKAIVHSAISSVLVKNTTELYSVKFAEHLGYKGEPDNRHQMLHFLKSKDTQKLLQGFATFLQNLARVPSFLYLVFMVPDSWHLNISHIYRCCSTDSHPLNCTNRRIPHSTQAVNRFGRLWTLAIDQRSYRNLWKN